MVGKPAGPLQPTAARQNRRVFFGIATARFLLVPETLGAGSCRRRMTEFRTGSKVLRCMADLTGLFERTGAVDTLKTTLPARLSVLRLRRCRPAAFVIALSLLSLGAPAYCSGLFDLEGRSRDLSEFTGQGKWLIVMFWASDCHVCNAEAQDYVLFHDRHHDKRAAILGITLDGQAGKAAALRFIERHMVDFPNLIGEPDVVARLFTALAGEPWLGTPSFLVFAPNGELRARQVGAVPVKFIEAFIERESAADP